MKIEEIQDRLAFLHLCLQYSNQNKNILTVYERIIVNQERGQLLRELELPSSDLRRVPKVLEAKLQQINKLTEQNQWKPLTPKEQNQQDGEY